MLPEQEEHPLGPPSWEQEEQLLELQGQENLSPSLKNLKRSEGHGGCEIHSRQKRPGAPQTGPVQPILRPMVVQGRIRGFEFLGEWDRPRMTLGQS